MWPSPNCVTQRGVNGRTNPPPPDHQVAERFQRSADAFAGQRGTQSSTELFQGFIPESVGSHDCTAGVDRGTAKLLPLLDRDGRPGLPTLQRRRSQGAPKAQGVIGLLTGCVQIVACSVAAVSILDCLIRCPRLQGPHYRFDRAIISRRSGGRQW